MLDRRNEPRMLCADLMDVYYSDATGRKKKLVVNLEDIAPAGACIQTEEAIPVDANISLSYPSGELFGVVRYCEYREIGYFVGVEFDDESRWSLSRFKPQHMLDPRRIVPRGGKPVKDAEGRTVQ